MGILGGDGAYKPVVESEAKLAQWRMERCRHERCSLLGEIMVMDLRLLIVVGPTFVMIMPTDSIIKEKEYIEIVCG